MSKKTVKGKKYSPIALTDGQADNDIDVAVSKAKYKATANCYPAGNTRVRQNSAYQNKINNKFTNFYSGFSADGTGDYGIPEAIRLCQLAYFNNGTVGNVVDIMQEFTVSDIDFLSKNKVARDIMLAWAKSIRLKGFLDAVALEYYRSGNVFIYRFDGTIKDADIRNVEKIFGSKMFGSIQIPTKYTLINPIMMSVVRSGLIDSYEYLVTIPASEVALMVQQFADNADKFDSLPKEFKEAFNGYNSKKSQDIIIKLDPKRVTAIYRKKQPYEQYAVPFLARVLDDIDFKKELRSMDRALARVISRLLVHVKVGNDLLIPTPASLEALNAKLANSSTSTYLVTDHTVSIAQYFPDVGNMLDPKKYTAVNADIIQALGISMAALGEGNGGFSNNFLGIKILVERIKDGRAKIVEEFLIPEVTRTVKAFQIKGDITPEIVGVDLNNEQEWAKIYNRLYELGVFSAQSVIEGIRDGRVPTYEEELTRQADMVNNREQGLFEPNLNGGGNSQTSGRPDGVTNPPQTKMKKSAPIGQNASKDFEQCKQIVSDFLLKRFKIKELSDSQLITVDNICKDFLAKSTFDKKSLAEFLNHFN